MQEAGLPRLLMKSRNDTTLDFIKNLAKLEIKIMALICGIDEAGRGSLCGSLFVAGVVGEEQMMSELKDLGVKDSKKLSKQKRFAIESLLKSRDDMWYFVVRQEAKDIDSKGLSRCLKESIEKIIGYFEARCGVFYIDGNTCFHLHSNHQRTIQSIIKGDDKVAHISCASIFAKCAKDREMQELDKLYPQYNLNNNAGYGTKSHIDAISKYGLSPLHRKSFVIKQQASSQEPPRLF